MRASRMTYLVGALSLLVSSAFADLYTEALALSKVGDYKGATAKLNEFVKTAKGQQNIDGQFLLADMYLAQGSILEAATAYEAVVNANPSAEVVIKARTGIAQTLEARGEFTRAVAQYKELVLQFRHKADMHSIWLHVANLFRRTLGQYNEAEKELTSLLVRYEKHANNGDALWELGQLYQHNLKNVRKAQETYVRLYTEYPKHKNSPAATVQSGYLLEDGGIRDWAKAITEYKNYVTANPNASDVYERLARIAYLNRDRLNQYQNAIDYYDQAFAVKPNPEILWEKATAAERTGKNDIKTAAYTQIVQKFPDSSQGQLALRGLANILWAEGKKNECIEATKKIVAKYPDSPDDLYNLANQLRDSERWDEGAANYDQLIQKFPQWNANYIYTYKANVYLSRHDNAVARKADAEAKAALGQAVEALQPVFTKFQGHTDPIVRALWMLAYDIYYTRAKDYDNAITNFQTIIGEHYHYQHWANRDYSIRWLTESHLAKSKNIDGAAQFVSQTLKKDPWSDNLRNGIAYLMSRYNALGEYAKSVALAKQVLDTRQSDWGDAWTLYCLGDAYNGLSLTAPQEQLPELHRKQLEAFAGLYNYHKNNAYGGMRSYINDIRQKVVKPLLREQSIRVDRMSNMLFKRDEKGESDETWATAALNDWTPIETGKDWGNFDGIGWYAADIDAVAEQGEYVAAFSNVDDQMWLYVDGKLAGSHSGASKPFTLRFNTEKTEGKIRIAVKVNDSASTGGIVGSFVIEKPRTIGKQELLNTALANQALGQFADAIKHYNDWLKDIPAGNAERDVAIRYMNWIDAQNQDIEKLTSRKPATPTEDYYLSLADVYTDQRDYTKAEATYKEAVEAFPASWNTLLALAKHYEDSKSKNYQLMNGAYQRLIAAMKGSPAEHRFKGHHVYMVNDVWRNYAVARELIAQYQAEQPQSGYWLRRYADHLYSYEKQDFQKAMGLYQRWMMSNDSLDPWHLGSQLWECLNRLGNHNAALAFTNMWLGKFSGHTNTPDMLYRQAMTQWNMGSENEAARAQAIAAFKKLQADFPTSSASYSAAYHAIQSYTPPHFAPIADATEMTEAWIKANPAHGYSAQLLWSLGNRMEREQDYGFDKALEVYRRIWKDFRIKWAENLYAYDKIANYHWGRREYDEAYSIYQEAMDHFGNNGDGRVKDAYHRLATRYNSFVNFEATPDSTNKQFLASRLQDGQADGNNGHPSYSWASEEGEGEHYIELAMKKAEEIRRVQVIWAGAQLLPQAIKLQYLNGNAFADVPGFEKFRTAEELTSTWVISPIKTTRIRILQKAGGGPKQRPNAMMATEVRLTRAISDTDFEALDNLYGQYLNYFQGHGETFSIGVTLCDYLAWRGEYMKSNIKLQQLLYAMPRNHPTFWDYAKAEAQKRMDQERYGEAAAIFRTMLSIHRGIDATRRSDGERLMGQALNKSGEAFANIDPSKPEAGLLWGNVFARSGEPDLAWERYQQNRELYFDHQHKLSFEFIDLIIRGLLTQRETGEAIKVCRHFLIKRNDDKHVSNAERARIQLLIGDAYFREERFEIAREEYNTVLTLPEYKDLPEHIQARFKVAQTLMSQKIFAKSQEILEDLATSPDEDTMSRAHLMLGILFHAQGEVKKAEAKFKEVLTLMPKNETADEIIYRLGTVYQERRKYKEALEALRLIGAWSGDSKRMVEPGRSLRIRLSDRDLTIARGSSEVPVIVTTSGGDEERILLGKSDIGKGLFVAEIDTELGVPARNDRKLQIMGNDTITYKYDPQWAKDFKIVDDPDSPPPVITVAGDAILLASATEIKEEEESELPVLNDKEEEKRDATRLFRDESQLKPGNLVYIKVTDPDLDITNAKDTATVVVEATSGDQVELTLDETGEHTGIFMGSVFTGNRPPDAVASDNSEGSEARYAIDGVNKASNAWVGSLDNRPPKWISVDLKEVHAISKYEWDRGEGYDPKEDRAPLRYIIEGSKDKKTWFPVAFYPENQAPLIKGAIGLWDPDGSGGYQSRPSAMLEGNGNLGNRWIGQPDLGQWIIDIDLGRVTQLGKTILRPQNTANEVRQFDVYVEKTPGKYPGKLRDLDAWVSVFKSPSLASAQTVTADYTVPKEPKEGDRKEPVKSQFIRLVINEAFGNFPEIGEFEIYPTFTFKAEIPEQGIGGTFTFDEPVAARHMRMNIHEFRTDAPAIAHIGIYDKDGKKLVPHEGSKIHELATNRVLELSPGDEVTVNYRDEKNIHPGEPKTYRESLSATYFNGFVRTIVHDFTEDQAGNRKQVDYMVRRIRPGDRFIVEIVEFDEDKTDGIDKIPFLVTTANGKKMNYDARETDPYSGIFTKEIDTSIDGAPNTLQVEEVDSITIEYMDNENTDPGHKAERGTNIYTSTPTDGKVRLISNIKRKVAPGDDKESTKLVAIEQDMEIEVLDPDAALHSGNVIKVKLTTTKGAEATVECKIGDISNSYNTYRGFQTALSDSLELGRFRGMIRVVLGDKSSPSTRVQVQQLGDGEFSSASSESSSNRRGKTDDPIMEVLNVMGGDVITAQYMDEVTPDNPLATERYDSARIISDAEFGIFDDEFEAELDLAHVGEKLHLQVIDPDMDVSEERDAVILKLESTFDDGTSDKLDIRLVESLSHSGVFTGSIMIKHADKGDSENAELEANFGNTVTAVYLDKYNTKSADAELLKAQVSVVTGTDGQMMAFSRSFPNDELAVETQFRVGECYFYLGKNHVELKQSETGLRELAEGQQILTELVTHHPESEWIDQIGYLLGNITQEQGKYDDAVLVYRRITRDYSESIIAADAQYKTALCFEKKGEFDQACEEYVRLAYKYPENALVADSMIRIGLYYFNKKIYETALGVFERFIDKFPDHSSVQKVSFKVGLSYILAERFTEGGDHFKGFVEKFPESEDLKPAALYWAGDSYLKANDALKSYQMFKRCIWDYPESKWAKFARGRLTAPIFDRISEME
ncbi:MAG: tetratricopeptide repeat protein [Planctomycetota bacterium]|nr:tetratricopeptide repeat protein [Planctomycetota bacterium]MDA1141728.1 tetratricopeptide repeat protein [Planctomycetota bacterium]